MKKKTKIILFSGFTIANSVYWFYTGRVYECIDVLYKYNMIQRKK